MACGSVEQTTVWRKSCSPVAISIQDAVVYTCSNHRVRYVYGRRHGHLRKHVAASIQYVALSLLGVEKAKVS